MMHELDGASSDASVLDEFVEVLHFIWQTRPPAVGALTNWRPPICLSSPRLSGSRTIFIGALTSYLPRPSVP